LLSRELLTVFNGSDLCISSDFAHFNEFEEVVAFEKGSVRLDLGGIDIDEALERN